MQKVQDTQFNSSVEPRCKSTHGLASKREIWCLRMSCDTKKHQTKRGLFIFQMVVNSQLNVHVFSVIGSAQLETQLIFIHVSCAFCDGETMGTLLLHFCRWKKKFWIWKPWQHLRSQNSESSVDRFFNIPGCLPVTQCCSIIQCTFKCFWVTCNTHQSKKTPQNNKLRETRKGASKVKFINCVLLLEQLLLMFCFFRTSQELFFPPTHASWEAA